MDPINQKERSKTILSFLGIFLLSILPICIGVYLFARVDSIENRHLRSVVKDQESVASESKDVEQLEKELSVEIINLNDFLVKRTQVVSPALSMDVKDKVGNISTLISELNDELKSADRKKYAGLLRDMKNAVANLNTIYTMVCEDYEKNKDELDDKEETIEKLNQKIDELLH